MRRMPAFLAPVSCLLATSLLPACGGPKNFLNTNDDLRRENLELTRQVEDLERKLQQRLAQIQTLNERLHGDALPEGFDPPVVSGLTIDSYSGPVDIDRDGRDDVLRLYLLPTDQRGRMLPVTGTLTAALLRIPDQGEPSVWKEVSLDPAQLDDAFRDGFTGPFYKVEMPLDGWPGGDVTVRCVLRSAGAATQRAQAIYPVERPAGDATAARDGL